ncbi:hypothetical protein JKF63_05215 [Porcisia hertigi]|uniref:Fragile site-associated protein C-terminal domain-containing protein n=1 Tax=Porcisia hertigi TaxID=2761500 RepID=A0A836LFN5_9TRYP|nr:hypothetical protein JKF63_05215 [Porcisia hertigi]
MSADDFDTSLFLKFLFSIVFLFTCCLCLMLYVDRVLALVLVLLLRLVVLPRNIRLSFSGLHFAPLQARVLFRGFSLQTENMSLRILDGYFTLAFWGSWFRHPRWSRLHEYMVGEALIGTRCRVRRNLRYLKGTIVAVNVNSKTVSVQFDEQNTNTSSPEEDEDVGSGEDGAGIEPPCDPGTGMPGDTRRSSLAQSGHRRTRLREFQFSPVLVPLPKQSTLHEPQMRSEGLGDEVVKTVDAKHVYIRNRAGLLRVHLNGVRLCLYNATSKYLDLAMAAAADAGGERSFDGSPGKDNKTGSVCSNQTAWRAHLPATALRTGNGRRKSRLAGLLQVIGKYTRSEKTTDLDAQEQDDTYESPELQAAQKVQEHNILATTFAQKFFNFIGCVEIEICSAKVDVGSLASSHPYFLHSTFQKGEGRVFLTKDGCPALDLYRTVVELTLHGVDIRMAKMNSHVSQTEVTNATLLERARSLLWSSAVEYDSMPLESADSSELIDDYGIFMDGKNKGIVHLVCYKDTSNVYAGEPVCRGALPTTGVEVLIDSPVVRYGPWLEYCRAQLWNYFLPPNYLPLEDLRFEVGKPRPNAGFELLIMFLRTTTIEIPFKRRSVVPSPPFGIRDSKRKGMIVATISEGAQYIQPAFFLLPKEEKQVFQGLFIAKNVTVWANCVLEREAVLCTAESLQFFVDRQDDRLWNRRKLWNILAKLSGAEFYWYTVYVDYFLDLLNDWKFSASMYHDVPLTTEMFNTLNRAVRDCIPNVKRFEIFAESMATLHINANTSNVVYAENPNDPEHNIMVTLKMRSGSFNVVLPSDQYQLSFENEVSRPIEAFASELKAYLSVPPSHPLYSEVSSKTPWAYAETFRLKGQFTIVVPNQSIPQPRDNLNIATGRTRYHNFLDLDFELSNLRGTLMGTHMKALCECFRNTFLDNPYTIAPDELFWLLAKLQSHATTGKNKRKELKNFVESSQPAGNDTEICVTVRLVDVSATAATGLGAGAPQVNLSTGLITFTYVKQFAVTDTGVSLAPVTVRFPERCGNPKQKTESNIVVGAITMGLTKHFGRMPLKPKIHEAMEVHVGGVSLDVTIEHLMVLVEVAQTVMRHVLIEDAMMKAEVAEALSVAELSAEKAIRAGPLHNKLMRPNQDDRSRVVGQSRASSVHGSLVASKEEATRTSSVHNPPTVDQDDKQEDNCGYRAAEVRQEPSLNQTALFLVAQPFPTDSNSEDRGAHGRSDDANDVKMSGFGHGRGESFLSWPPSALIGPQSGFAATATAAAADAITTTGDGDGSKAILPASESVKRHWSFGKPRRRHKRRRSLFGSVSTNSPEDSEGSCSGPSGLAFASKVPHEVALGFAKFREECNKADDNSRDYGVFFFKINVEAVRGVVCIGDDGYASVKLPLGVTMAHSTVNDGNSNRRMSIAMKDLCVQMFLSRASDVAHTYLPSLRDDASSGQYLEVLSLHTSVCVRQYVAYPFDNSLEKHRKRQRQFVEENDYEHLINIPFHRAPMQYSETLRRGFSQAAGSTAQDAPRADEGSPVRTRAQSTGASAAEPATLPRPPFSNAAASPSGAYSLSTSSLQARAAVAPLLVDRERMSPMSSSNMNAATDGDVAIELPPTRAFMKALRGLSLSTLPDSQGTPLHTQLSEDMDNASQAQSTCLSFSTSSSLSEKDNAEVSNCFATCVSVPSERLSCGRSSPDKDSFFENAQPHRLSRRRGMAGTLSGSRSWSADTEEQLSTEKKSSSDDVLCTDRRIGLTANPRGSGGGPSKSKEDHRDVHMSGAVDGTAAVSPVDAHLFYRTFDKVGCTDNGTCAVDYQPPQRPHSVHWVPDRTRFHAQPPIVGFYLNTSCENRAPSFFSYSNRWMAEETEDQLSWARCVADNRERSENNSTSRHLHIAFLNPLTLLVTPEAAVLAGVATQLVLRLQHSPRSDSSERPSNLPPSGDHVLRGPKVTQLLLPRRRVKKSKARTQQKRWLWENNIVSVAVPTIEVKVLTRLPVPVENLPNKSSVTDGVYTSTIVLRNLRVLMSHNRPPTGEDMVAEAMQKMSLSVKMDTLAMITQIEWEPIKREGNLNSNVPGVWYNTTKDTIAVVFLTQVVGRIKRDLWRGADGVASNITIADISLCMTCDFSDYIHALVCLVQDVMNDARVRVGVKEHSLFGERPSPAVLSPASSPIRQKSAASNFSTASDGIDFAANAPFREVTQLPVGHFVQGKGFVGHFTVTVMETALQGQRVVVSQTKMSRLVVRRPLCNFVVVTPSLPRDRNVHVQGVGEVDEVFAAVLPSVLRMLHPRTVQRRLGVVASKVWASKPLGSHTSLALPNIATSVGTADFKQSFTNTKGPLNSPSQIDAAEQEHRGVTMIYNTTFTVHQLDLRAEESATNYLQVMGKELTGCAESRAEGVASRECVQTEALTEAISERLKTRLRYKANKARERAKSTRYPAPPNTTEQLLLRSTMSFFAQQMQAHYVADCAMEPIPHESGSALREAPASQSLQTCKVFTAAVTDVALVAQFSQQVNLNDDQASLHIMVRTSVFQSPYCVRATETLHPQVHALIGSWRHALQATSQRMANKSAGDRFGRAFCPPRRKSSTLSSEPGSARVQRRTAVTFQVQATGITGFMGLPQGVVQKYLLPQISLFSTSSNGRTDLKVHIHPFTITTPSTPMEDYRVVLPHLYILYAQDEIKMLCSVTVGTIAITITPLFINHSLLVYEKLIDDVTTVMAAPKMYHADPNGPATQDIFPGKDADATGRYDTSSYPRSGLSKARGSGRGGGSGHSPGAGYVFPKDADLLLRSAKPGKVGRRNPRYQGTQSFDDAKEGAGSAAASATAEVVPARVKEKRRKSFLFLLHGVRLSHLTSMTTLRFTIRSLSVTADTTEGSMAQALHWVVHGANVQVALVDRNDHNQMAAVFDSLSKLSQSASRDMHVSSAAYVSSCASSSERASDVANNMKAAHPLSGFLWGSVALSFTLSSGKTDEYRARAALQKGGSLGSYSEELQKELLYSLTNSSSEWELALYEPLVVMRFGLDALVKQCIQETKDDIRLMEEASHNADLNASMHLQQHRRFRQLRRQKKRIDSLIQRAAKERRERLRTMAERVVHDVTHRRQRDLRGMSRVDEWVSLFNIRRSHKVVASVSNFMVVVPFGDAAYRSILEEMPGTFECGKADRHVHKATCLKRSSFIPSRALKLKMDDVSFICSFELVKQLLREGDADQRDDVRDDFTAVIADAMKQSYRTALHFHGRLLALKSYLYFSDGSPLDKSATLLDLLRDTPILGGQGVLTSYAADEHRRALNSIAVTTIEAPLHVERKNDTTHIVVVVDVSEPKARASSRIFSIMKALAQEQAASPLQAHMNASHRGQIPLSFPLSHTNRCTVATTRERHVDPLDVKRAEKSAAPPLLPKKPLSLRFHITGRLEASELAIFCHTDPARWNAGTAASAASGSNGGRTYTEPRSLRNIPGSGARRRVGFETPTSQNNRMRATMGARAAANAAAHDGSATTSQTTLNSESAGGIDFNSSERYLITSIPLPGVSLQALVRRGTHETSDDMAMVRVEVRAGTIELSPSIAVLAREVEMCASADEKNRMECNEKIIRFVQRMEAEVPQLRVPLHCPLMEVLLPMPRVYQALLSRVRMENVLRLRRSHTTTLTPTEFGSSATGADDSSHAGNSHATVGKKRTLRGITAVHVSIMDLRLIFNSEPVASTHFMFYLDDGGTIDFVLEHFEHTKADGPFVDRFPSISLIVTMRQARAEFQTKLEVKSFEMALPEAELTMSRRGGRIGLVDSVAIHFPFNASGSEPNLMMRLHHVSQLFLVVDLWSITTSETLMTARRLFRKGGTCREAPEQTSGAQFSSAAAMCGTLLQDKPRVAADTRRFFYLGLSDAVCFLDLGTGSTHRFTIGAANAAAEIAKDSYGSTVSTLIARISNTNIRSEGVLSGGIIIGNVVAKAFVIHNADDAQVFLRSPEQRTFRGAVVMQNVHVNVKERQLRDVFECKVSHLHAGAMDGIGEEEYATTDMTVLLQRSTLGLTPSTVPAFLNFVRNISTVVAEQRRIAASRRRQRVLLIATGRRGPDGGKHAAPDSPTPILGASVQRTHSCSGRESETSVATRKTHAHIPFMGNTLLRVPCGQLCVGLEGTTVLLGAFASGEAAAGSVVLSFPSAHLSFAECPCDDYRSVKKVLVMESHNVELYRPGMPRIVVMGFKGVNHFEFFTQQLIGSAEVGFKLTLRQTHPWTGNPRFRDFEEIVSLIKSFTNKKNADVFQHFGRLDTPTMDTDNPTLPAARDFSSNLLATTACASVGGTSTTVRGATAASSDRRILKALCSSKFSPQLRFGGDVSVNTEVILNWLGVTEKMLPHVVHVGLCDKLERLLSFLSDFASERMTHRIPRKTAVLETVCPTGGAEDTRSSTAVPRPFSPPTSETEDCDVAR